MIPVAGALSVVRLAHAASRSSFWERVAEACAPIAVGIGLSTAAGMLRRWHKRRMRERDRAEGVTREAETIHVEHTDEGVAFTIDGATVMLSHEQAAELAEQVVAGAEEEPEPKPRKHRKQRAKRKPSKAGAA